MKNDTTGDACSSRYYALGWQLCPVSDSISKKGSDDLDSPTRRVLCVEDCGACLLVAVNEVRPESAQASTSVALVCEESVLTLL